MTKRAAFFCLLIMGAVLLSLMILPTRAATQTPGPEEADPREKAAPPVRLPAPAPESRSQTTAEKLRATARKDSAVPLIVGVKTDVPFVPEGKRAVLQSVQRQRQAINTAQETLLDSLSSFSITLNARYKHIPYIALTVDGAGLKALLDSPLVTSVHEDGLDAPLLDSSVPIIGAAHVWAAGYDGSGWAVAVLDTGVQWNHEFLGGISSSRVITEACYSRGEDWYNPGTKGSLCAPEPHAADATVALCWSGATNICNHGTHVAGIAAGSHAGASVAYDGVAPGVDIIAIQVFSYFEAENDVLSWDSDQLLGLERVYDMSFSYNIAAVNVSLGGADRYTDHCDSDPRKAAIDNLRSVGIATVIASGNSGFTDGTNAPACISSAVAVGGTQDDDTLIPWSNSSEMVHLLAPGQGVNSSVPGNAYAGMNGTSMSAPHVAGAWALLKQANPTATVDEILDVLQDTGVPVTDARNGITKPRIQVDEALPYMMGGFLSGAVKEDAAGYPPITGAIVRASNPTYTLQTTTDASGAYHMRVLVGTYTVTAVAYGYQPATVTELSVSSDATTTQDFMLTAYTDYYTVSGVISDANTGWPLYASITVDGNPIGPPEDTFWSHPVTGYYSLTLAEGVTYTFDVNAWVAGYVPDSRTVGPLTMDTPQDVALDVDAVACTAPGYTMTVNALLLSEDFETWPLSGWSIVDNAPDGGGSGCVWYGDDDLEDDSEGNLTGGSGNFADADSDNCGMQSMDTELISPPFDASPYEAILVDFSYHKGYGSDAADVDLFDGANWNTIWTAPSNTDGRAMAKGPSSTADARVRFHYYDAYWDYWWQVDDVRISGATCVPLAGGGLVIGNVYDNNSSHGLDGATVSNESGYSTTTGPTPDPAVDEGFYTLFSPQGSRVFTATRSGYAPDVQMPTVSLSGAIRQDFHLEAPAIEVAPSGLSAVLGGAATSVQTLTITNIGTLDLDWEISEAVPWAGVSPVGGTVAPGLGTGVDVTFDSSGLGPGAYFGTLVISSTAPADPQVLVPLTLTLESGTLQGRVTEIGSGAPITAALVTVDPVGLTTLTDMNGEYGYALLVYDGYTVTVAAFGYESGVATGVNIAQGVTTTLDFQLTPILPASVEGTVRDGSGHGWPLYARLEVEGFQFEDVLFTNPVSGYYSTTLPQGVPFTFTVKAGSAGYTEIMRVITPGATENFTLDIDPVACTAPGYTMPLSPLLLSEVFETWPLSGWSIVDNAADGGGSGCVWYGDDDLEDDSEGNLTGGSGNFADADSDNCGEQDMDTELISPPFDASPYEAILVDFSYNYETYLGDDVADVDLFDGVNWNTIWTAPDDTGGRVRAGGLSSAADTRVRFHYYDANWEWWWQVDEVRISGATCVPLAGGLVVGNVYDRGASDGLNDAKVTSIHHETDTTTTWATPDDPVVDDGFYILFSSLTGDHPFEASAPGYITSVQTPTIVADAVATQDFVLYRKFDVFLPLISLRFGSLGNGVAR